MSDRRFADDIDWAIAQGDCPSCGFGLPGPHRKFCPTRAAELDVEKNVPSKEGRRAILRLIRALTKV